MTGHRCLLSPKSRRACGTSVKKMKGHFRTLYFDKLLACLGEKQLIFSFVNFSRPFQAWCLMFRGVADGFSPYLQLKCLIAVVAADTSRPRATPPWITCPSTWRWGWLWRSFVAKENPTRWTWTRPARSNIPFTSLPPTGSSRWAVENWALICLWYRSDWNTRSWTFPELALGVKFTAPGCAFRSRSVPLRENT